MAASKKRDVYIWLPSDVLAEIDARAGPRKRSAFIREAIEERLKILRRVEAFERAVATPTEGIAAWETSESTAEWVRAQRAGAPLVLPPEPKV